MKTYNGKVISKKHIANVIKSMDVTRICKLYKEFHGYVPTEERPTPLAISTGNHNETRQIYYTCMNVYDVRRWAEQFVTSQKAGRQLYYLFMNKNVQRWAYRSDVEETASHSRHGVCEPLRKQYIVEYLKKQCLDPESNYAKRPMLGYTHLYFCSPVYGHSDYNKWRALPIKGNERFCELVIKYADRFFGPIYDK